MFLSIFSKSTENSILPKMQIRLCCIHMAKRVNSVGGRANGVKFLSHFWSCICTHSEYLSAPRSWCGRGTISITTNLISTDLTCLKLEHHSRYNNTIYDWNQFWHVQYFTFIILTVYLIKLIFINFLCLVPHILTDSFKLNHKLISFVVIWHNHSTENKQVN